MRKSISILLILIIQITCAQEQVAFKKEVFLIDSLIQKGAYDEADAKLLDLKVSLEGTSLSQLDTVRLFFSSKRAFIADRLGDCERTIKISREDVSLREEIYGQGDVITLSARRNLGIYYLNCDSIHNAKEILEQVLATHKVHFQSPDEVYAKTLDDLAFVYGQLGELDNATNTYEELISLLGQNKSSFYLHVIENYSALLMTNEKYAEALPYYEVLKDEMNGKTEYPSFLKDYYNVFVHLKDYTKALDASTRLASWCAENDCSQLNISKGEFELNSARLAMLLYRHEEAKKFYKQSIKSLGDSKQYASILLEQASLYAQLNDRFNQLNSLNKVITYHRSTLTTDSTTYSDAVFRLGTLYSQLGRFSQANDLFSDYISDLESNSATPPERLAIAYQSLGNQRLLLQDFRGADAHFSKAQRLLEENKLTERKEYASVLNSYGALYETLANFEQAEKNYRRALAILFDQTNTLRTTLASNLANILIKIDPSNDSIVHYLSKAIEWQHSHSGETHPVMANLYASRGVYYLKQNKLDEAKTDLLKSQQIFEYTVTEDHPQYLSALTNLGLVYDAQEMDDLAESTMLIAASLYEKYYTESNPGYIRTLNNLANYYARVEKYDQAEPLFIKLSHVQLTEISQSFSYLSESEKKAFVQEKKKLLNNFKGYVVARSLTEEEVIEEEVIEQWYNLELGTKGILLNSTKKVREAIFSSEDEELIQLFTEWTLTRKEIADLQSLKSDLAANNKTRLDSLISTTNELEKELSRRYSDFSQSFSVDVPSYDDIRRKLNPGEATVEIIRTELNGEGIYTALVGMYSQEFPKLIVIGKGDEIENKGFKAYKNAISYKVANSRSFDLYWKRIDSYLSKNAISKIYYAPDGVFHKLNPLTFYHSEKEDYLIDELEIVQVSSTKDLLHFSSSSEIPKKALLVGRPTYKIGGSAQPVLSSSTRSFELLSNVSDLPGTQEEIEEISKLLAKKNLETQVLLKDNATEKEIKLALNNELVHIATHGFFLDDANEGVDPMLSSGLLLAGVSNRQKGTESEDGILTAYEIMNLSLSNLKLVVLSACETGLGEVSSGEGIYGLQRAFFVGGVETLVMSLWKVDDAATRDLMIEFYKEYLKSGNRKESFTTAQKKLKKKYKDPIYWGAFVMIGH